MSTPLQNPFMPGAGGVSISIERMQELVDALNQLRNMTATAPLMLSESGGSPNISLIVDRELVLVKIIDTDRFTTSGTGLWKGQITYLQAPDSSGGTPTTPGDYIVGEQYECRVRPVDDFDTLQIPIHTNG